MNSSSSTVVPINAQVSLETRAQPDSSLWQSADVAAYLQVSLSWVRHRVAAGKLPHHRVGGRMVRFDPAEIRAWATARARR